MCLNIYPSNVSTLKVPNVSKMYIKKHNYRCTYIIYIMFNVCTITFLIQLFKLKQANILKLNINSAIIKLIRYNIQVRFINTYCLR